MASTKITKSWTSKSGATVVVNGELITERKVWLDGDEDTVPCCEIRVSVTHSKAGYQGSEARKMTPAEMKRLPAGVGSEFTHICGNMAITEQNAEIINSVRRELEATPEWQTKTAYQNKANAESEEYERTEGRLLREMDREDSDY